jgi:hypothetical protein
MAYRSFPTARDDNDDAHFYMELRRRFVIETRSGRVTRIRHKCTKTTKRSILWRKQRTRVANALNLFLLRMLEQPKIERGTRTIQSSRRSDVAPK